MTIEKVFSYFQSILKEQSNHFPFDSTLMGGSAGNLLFLSAACKNGFLPPEILKEHLDYTIKNFSTLDHSFSVGTSGLYFVLTYMHDACLINDKQFARLDMSQIYDSSLQLYKSGNTDFMHGALGISFMLLYSMKSFKNHHSEYFNSVFKLLHENISNINNKKMFRDFNFVTNEVNISKVNFGLAHGIPSILKFCLLCIQQHINTEDATYIARAIIAFLIKHANNDTHINYFPYCYDEERRMNTYSRLAWCYGDMGVGYILYQASIVFEDIQLSKFALGVLKKTTYRTALENTQIIDPGLCHGAAGVAYIYHKLYISTGVDDFRKSHDYWTDSLGKMSIFEDGVGGFKKYNESTGVHIIDYGLLEGTAGIGLSLLSYLTGDYSWDYCLMLND